MRQASWSTPGPTSPPDFWHDHGPSESVQAEIRKTKTGEFGAGRPDFGGRWPRGEALDQSKDCAFGNNFPRVGLG